MGLPLLIFFCEVIFFKELFCMVVDTFTQMTCKLFFFVMKYIPLNIIFVGRKFPPICKFVPFD